MLQAETKRIENFSSRSPLRWTAANLCTQSIAKMGSSEWDDAQIIGWTIVKCVINGSIFVPLRPLYTVKNRMDEFTYPRNRGRKSSLGQKKDSRLPMISLHSSAVCNTSQFCSNKRFCRRPSHCFQSNFQDRRSPRIFRATQLQQLTTSLFPSCQTPVCEQDFNSRHKAGHLLIVLFFVRCFITYQSLQRNKSLACRFQEQIWLVPHTPSIIFYTIQSHISSNSLNLTSLWNPVSQK